MQYYLKYEDQEFELDEEEAKQARDMIKQAGYHDHVEIAGQLLKASKCTVTTRHTPADKPTIDDPEYRKTVRSFGDKYVEWRSGEGSEYGVIEAQGYFLAYLGCVRVMTEDGYKGRVAVTDPAGYRKYTQLLSDWDELLAREEYAKRKQAEELGVE